MGGKEGTLDRHCQETQLCRPILTPGRPQAKGKHNPVPTAERALALCKRGIVGFTPATEKDFQGGGENGGAWLALAKHRCVRGGAGVAPPGWWEPTALAQDFRRPSSVTPGLHPSPFPLSRSFSREGNERPCTKKGIIVSEVEPMASHDPSGALRPQREASRGSGRQRGLHPPLLVLTDGIRIRICQTLKPSYQSGLRFGNHHPGIFKLTLMERFGMRLRVSAVLNKSELELD